MINWAMKPTTDLPSRGAKKISERISPSNQEGSALRGFLSGATEGAGNVMSDMTSPLSLATMALGPLMGMIGKGAQGAARGIGPTMDLIEEAPMIKQTMGSMDDVGSLIGDMQRNLARIPSKGQGPRGISPSNLPAEMVGLGDEAAHNVGRNARIVDWRNSVDDVADAGNRMSGRMRMGDSSNIDVARKMSELARARGR